MHSLYIGAVNDAFLSSKKKEVDKVVGAPAILRCKNPESLGTKDPNFIYFFF